MSKSIIELQNIEFFYEKGKPIEMHALKGINISINQGEFISFFGPSGCGKSTLLYIISGIDAPHGGRVIINDHDISKLSASELAVFRQMGIGIIFQNFNLIPSITILDNVMLPMAFLGIGVEKRKERAESILKELNIESLSGRYPYELSGGQQQRVGIARALANDPPIILADEPTGNLDSVNAMKTMELLRDFNKKQGKTVILVTHEAWSLKYVDRVFHMKDGIIVKTEAMDPSVAPDIAAEKGMSAPSSQADSSFKAKAVVGGIMRGYPRQQRERFETVLSKRLQGEIDRDTLEMELDKPFRDGGVGLWKQKAVSVASAVEDFLSEGQKIADFYKKIGRESHSSLMDEIDGIRDWLFSDYGGKLSLYQIEKINESIMQRLQNVITPDQFVKVLDQSKREGGVGLSSSTGLKIAEKFETVISMKGMAFI